MFSVNVIYLTSCAQPAQRQSTHAWCITDAAERGSKRPRLEGVLRLWKGDDPTPPRLGDLTLILELDTAGLSARGEWQFYVRTAMKEQWDFLVNAFDDRHNETEGDVKYYNHLLVGGPPGTGKSSTTWMWCQWMAQVRGQSVLWVHKTHGPGGSFSICLLDAQGIHTFEQGPTQELDRRVWDLATVCAIVVFDGVTADDDSNLKSTIEGWLNVDRRDRLLVYCASVAVHLKAEVGAQCHRVSSWKLDDYASACLLDSFWANVEGVMHDASTDEGNNDDDDGGGALTCGANDSGDSALGKLTPVRRVLVESKFFIAGHCARWMFGLPSSAVMDDINAHINKVGSLSSLLDKDMGESTNRQINHLRATLAIGHGRESTSVFVSEYVARTLSQHGDVEVKFMSRLNAFANRSGNPTFVGWCVEFDFLMQLRREAEAGDGGAITLSLKDVEVAWPVKRCREFDTVFDVGALVDLAADDWLIPRRFNQGTFDAVHLLEESTIGGGKRRIVRFVNVTCALRHNLNSTYVYRMMRALEESKWLSRPPNPSLEFIFVRPMEHKGKPFAAEQPSPHGSLTKHYDWQGHKRKEAFFARSRDRDGL